MGVASSDACCTSRDEYPEEGGPENPLRPVVSPRKDLRWAPDQCFILCKEGQEETFKNKAQLIQDVGSVREAVERLNNGSPVISDGICVVKARANEANVYYCCYTAAKRDEAYARFRPGEKIPGMKETALKAEKRAQTPKARRGGVQLSSEKILEGLKSQFSAMDKLEDLPQCPDIPKDGTTNDIEFIRILKPNQFKDFLQIHGVPVRDWGNAKMKTKSLEELWAEVSLRECTLVKVQAGLGSFTLERVVNVVFLEIEAVVDNSSRYLLLQDEKTQFASRNNLRTRPSKKMFDDEEVEEAVWRCIYQNLDIKDKKARQHFAIQSVEERVEEKSSGGFPGLPTTYNMHVARLKVRDPSHADMDKLGLPSGKNFQTSARFIRHKTTRTWTWCSCADFQNAVMNTSGVKLQRVPSREYLQ